MCLFILSVIIERLNFLCVTNEDKIKECATLFAEGFFSGPISFYLLPMPDQKSLVDKFVQRFNPLLLTVPSLLITWIITGIGASIMLCVTYVPDHLMGVAYSIIAGVMSANAMLGLIPESLAQSRKLTWCKNFSWLPPIIGLTLGVIMMNLITAAIYFIHAYKDIKQTDIEVRLLAANNLQDVEPYRENKSIFKRIFLNIIAGTIAEDDTLPVNTAISDAAGIMTHNDSYVQTMQSAVQLALALIIQQIPEGIMTGIAFENVWETSGVDGTTEKAMRIAGGVSIGTWITSFTEGTAMMLALGGAGIKPWRCFLFVMIASNIETIFGILGCMVTSHMKAILPFALAAVSSAMIFTVVTEIIPQAIEKSSKMVVANCFMLSFAIMLILINLFP
jgi:zinc transporter ZupT